MFDKGGRNASKEERKPEAWQGPSEYRNKNLDCIESKDAEPKKEKKQKEYEKTCEKHQGKENGENFC